MSSKISDFKIFLTLATLFLFSSCDPTSSEDIPVPYEEIHLSCIDQVSFGSALEVVVNSQEEYEELIYQQFQKPLDLYWDRWYESTLQLVKEQNPGLTELEYEKLARELIYQAYPFKGTENCSHPEIDFSRYTLLGKSTEASGCRIIEHIFEVKKRNSDYYCRIIVKVEGDCSLSLDERKWLLIPKISASASVKFETIAIR